MKISFNKWITIFTSTLSLGLIAFPINAEYFGSPFVAAQIAFILLLPFALLQRTTPIDAIITLIIVSLFIYTVANFESPTFGFLYLLSCLIIGRKSTPSKGAIKVYGVFAFWLFVTSITLGFISGSDRTTLLGGDPNFTAFALSLLFPVIGLLKRQWTIAYTIAICLLIVTTFSRSGLLFLTFLLCYKLLKTLKFKLKNINDGNVLITTQVLSLILSFSILYYLFGNEMPDYVYRQGFEKFQSESLVDVSNFIRLKANLFFLEDNFSEIALAGAHSNDAVAYEFGDKFIRPHHFIASMVFEFGCIATILILATIHRRSYWRDKSMIISIIVFGSTLGFSYYYGFILFLMLIMSNLTKSQLAKPTIRSSHYKIEKQLS